MKLAALILAAGASRRLGRPKQLEPVGGVPLARRTAVLALEAGFHPVRVLLGHEAESVHSVLEGLSVETCFNAEWESGMASSIVRGLEGLPPGIDGVLILLVDHVALTPMVLHELRRTFLENPDIPVASSYGGLQGVPALFPRSWFDALARLQGDQGARFLLRNAEVSTFPWPDGLKDLDTDSTQP